MRPLSQESNPDILRQAALLLERENTKLIATVIELKKEVLQLKGMHPSELQLKLIELERQLSNSNRARFGRSTEKRETPKEASPRPPQTGHGPRAQPQLGIVEEVHCLDEADKACKSCGGTLTEWAGQFEESELIDAVERKFFIRKVKRQKYRCECGGCVETALGPTTLIPGGRYAPDFAVEAAISKYLDHLPLQRQVKIMSREGLEVTASTLWNQLEAAAHVLQPVYDRIRAHVLSAEVIGIDETHWKMLGDSGGEHAQKTWQTWAVAGPDAVAYKILPSRSAEAAREVLGDFSGIAMADGYGVYEHLAKEGRVTFAGCWGHARRKFFELEKAISSKTREDILALIGELYAVEKEAGKDFTLLARLRLEKSRGILVRIQEWLIAHRQKALPRSAFARAIEYTLTRWTALTRFVEDARIPLDNNATERALRGPVVGRKNHYGSKSQRGTEVAALFYTLCETAKLSDFEPKEYVRSCLYRALNGAPPLLPKELAAELDAAIAPAA